MSFSFEKRQEILKDLLKEIKNNPTPALTISQRFGISKQTVYKYILQLVEEGDVLVQKQGKRNMYSLKEKITHFCFSIAGLEEDVVWREKIFPLIKKLPSNLLNACNYGFTEMLNNAIDHSEAQEVDVYFTEDAVSVQFMISDFGVGIFNKIQKSLNLDDPKHAILELAKGKLTTDPTKHSGEGIFFTSRVFDGFYISSGGLQFLSGSKNGHDTLFDDLLENSRKGTCVIMDINKDSNVVISDVFNAFTATNDDYGFSKTHIPVRLAKYEGEMLVSRSQAKRLIRRFERFKEVVLDFKDVTEIGQAFADELFRVFKIDHPEVELIPIHMSEEVRKMVFRATSNSLSN